MAYGTLKVDNITYTSGGSDASTSVSGIVALQAGNFNNITATGTISGVTVTGVTANFQSGVFTTQVSGAIVAGPTHTGTVANFVAGNFTTAITGVTVTGGTANFNNGNYTGTLSGATVTGNTGQFTNVTGGGAGFTTITGTTISGTNINGNSANFTNTVTGVTFSGTTINAQSGVFTTQVSGATVIGNTVTGTTSNFSSGNFTGTLSGATTIDSAGNVRDIPQNSQTTSYTLQASDVGKHIFTISGVTVPSGVFSVGQAVSIYNNTTGNLTITQGTNVTLRQAGASGTGNRTLAQRGLATVLCVSGTVDFVICGAGLT